MSRLKEMINELCPDGVQYVELATIADIGTGSSNTNEGLEEGKYPFFVRSQDVRRKNEYEYDETAIITSGDGVGVGKIFHYIEGKYALHQRAYRIHITNDKVVPKFFFYYMKATFLSYIEKNAVNSSVTSVRRPMMNKYPVPIPPIEVQLEIVRILDNFTELTSELTSELISELTARKKQYEYYRDELLSFSGRNIEWKTLDEISTEMYRGSGIKRDQVTEDGIQCVRYGEIYTSYDISFNKCISHTNENNIKSKKYFEYGDILFAITGESVEEIAKSIVYLGNNKCLAGGDIVVMKHNQNPKYLSYALSTKNAQMQKSKGKVKSKVVHSSIPALKEILVPIPSLEEQERIANILDNFYDSCNGILEGISAEIEARQKQYEYYRDKILEFKNKEEK